MQTTRVLRTLSPTSQGKRELREFISKKLATVSQAEIARQTRQVTDAILQAPWFQNSQRISVYVHTSGEVETDMIVEECLRLGKTLFIPQFKRKNPRMRLLRLHSLQEFHSLDTTLWNIRQPHQESSAEEYQESGPLDVILMPGVAFTSDGKRLGHGMGYYDRLLDEHDQTFGRQPLKVGLSLNEQMVSDLPTSSRDVQLDMILSEHAVHNAEDRDNTTGM